MSAYFLPILFKKYMLHTYLPHKPSLTVPCFLHQIGQLKLVFLGTVFGKTQWRNWKNPRYTQVFPMVVLSVFQIVLTLLLSYYLFFCSATTFLYLSKLTHLPNFSKTESVWWCLFYFMLFILSSIVFTLDLQHYLINPGTVFE